MAIAPTRSQARLFAQLIAELEPRIRAGFMAAVTDLTANVNWRELLAKLEAGDIEGAIAALNISPAAWQQYRGRECCLCGVRLGACGTDPDDRNRRHRHQVQHA